MEVDSRVKTTGSYITRDYLRMAYHDDNFSHTLSKFGRLEGVVVTSDKNSLLGSGSANFDTDSFSAALNDAIEYGELVEGANVYAAAPLNLDSARRLISEKVSKVVFHRDYLDHLEDGNSPKEVIRKKVGSFEKALKYLLDNGVSVEVFEGKVGDVDFVVDGFWYKP